MCEQRGQRRIELQPGGSNLLLAKSTQSCLQALKRGTFNLPPFWSGLPYGPWRSSLTTASLSCLVRPTPHGINGVHTAPALDLIAPKCKAPGEGARPTGARQKKALKIPQGRFQGVGAAASGYLVCSCLDFSIEKRVEMSYFGKGRRSMI